MNQHDKIQNPLQQLLLEWSDWAEVAPVEWLVVVWEEGEST